MIPEAHIRGWRENAPWTDDAMVEQDLLICRALAAIFSDEFLSEQLAFRGGTTLHKLYLHPQSRYSKDKGIYKGATYSFCIFFKAQRYTVQNRTAKSLRRY